MWIRFPEEKPEHDIIAVVYNCKGFMDMVIASYHKNYDLWLHYHGRESFTLEVSHYLPIPPRTII